MTTKGFIITSYGDSSVGIFDQTFKLEGDFEFANEQSLELFRLGMEKLFAEYVTDGDPNIQTFEEIDEQITAENEMMGLNYIYGTDDYED